MQQVPQSGDLKQLPGAGCPPIGLYPDRAGQWEGTTLGWGLPSPLSTRLLRLDHFLISIPTAVCGSDSTPEGLVGPKGDTGETGVTGVEGPRGFPGTPGRKGEPGESAYVHRSAFSVGLESRITVPNVPIRFTKIFYNLQNHYDGTTGKFHCNIPGLYYFSYHITVYLKDVKVSLYKKDKAMLFTYDQYQEKNVDQASGSVLLHLEVGDQVWLQVYGDGDSYGIYADNVNDSTFTGFLLYHDTN
uniref:Adiponectin, C1Q and collagen domain containing n=2 Tax=Canis lupus familiaris TaxID=9615 RepID=A0A8I3PIE0_CANLF